MTLVPPDSALKLTNRATLLASFAALAAACATGAGTSRRVPPPERQAVTDSAASRRSEPPPPRATSGGPAASAATPPGVLEGRVVDGDTGEPIAAAQVVVGGTPVGALTDAAGRFRLAPLPPGPQVVQTRRIGFATESLPAVFAADSGYVAVVALRESDAALCVLYVTAPKLFTVRVRDVRTGLPPASGATLTATRTDGHVVSTSTPVPSSAGHLVLAAVDLTEAGTYTLVVRSPGYRAWQRAGVRNRSGSCGDVVPAIFDAWLLPR